MFAFTESVLIKAPPAAVWSLLCDLERWWLASNPEHDSLERLDDSSSGDEDSSTQNKPTLPRDWLEMALREDEDEDDPPSIADITAANHEQLEAWIKKFQAPALRPEAISPGRVIRERGRQGPHGAAQQSSHGGA
jgi:hypothetical protein